MWKQYQENEKTSRRLEKYLQRHNWWPFTQNLQRTLKTEQEENERWANYLNKHFTREDMQITNKHMKRCYTSYVIREMLIKQKWVTTTHLLGQNQEHRHHQMLTRIWSNRDSTSLLVGMESGTTIVDSLAISYKTKHTLTVRSSSFP